MKTFHTHNIVLALLALLLLHFNLSCSGGSLIAGGGIDGTGVISKGIITSFGSIVVNGNTFDTSNAAVIVDGIEVGIGDNAVMDNLDVGRLVVVEGYPGIVKETFFADRVIYSDNIEGPVESIIEVDANTKEIIILGQSVILNVNTEFKDTDFAALARDDVIGVSGLFDEAGKVWATFIEKTGVSTPGLEFEVTGYVTNLEPDLLTFNINDLAVDYRLADTSGLPLGELQNGMLVEVEGGLGLSGDVLEASAIKPENGLETENADQIEITGFVTRFDSTSEFRLGNQVILIDPEAIFVDGSREDIAPGVKLEAEGTLAGSILHAWSIEFWKPEQIEVEEKVTGIVSSAEFTVGGQLVQTDENTVYEGGTPDDIGLGVLLEIKGVPADRAYSILFADKVSFEEE